MVRGVLAFCAVIMLGLTAEGMSDVKSPGVWFEPSLASSAAPKAVVLLAHGLNLKPSKMDSLAGVLQQNGAAVLRLTLTGHQDDSALSMEAFKNVDPDEWRDDFNLSYEAAAARARSLHVPFYFVGFSLGALVGVDDLLQPDSQKHFDKMFLLAPAISLKVAAKWIFFLKPLGRGFCIPSANSPAYRVHRCTPMGAYESLLATGRDLRSRAATNADVPTLVIGDPRDELVSLAGLEKWAGRENLSQWKFTEITGNETTLPRKIHHLVVDEASAGKANWNIITRALLKHFSL